MKSFFAILFLAISAYAQPNVGSNTPDCYFSETLTTATRTATFNNSILKCTNWRLQVVNLSNGAARYTYDYSSNGSTWTTIGTQEIAATVANTAATFSTAQPYLSVNLSKIGTGSVIIVLTGYYASSPVFRNNVNSGAPEATPYSLVKDVASSTVTYIGQAKSIFDPVTNTGYAIFAVQKLTYDGSGNLTSVQNADGDTNEDNVWSNRASLTYK
jgi:hypothetical protein